MLPTASVLHSVACLSFSPNSGGCHRCIVQSTACSRVESVSDTSVLMTLTSSTLPEPCCSANEVLSAVTMSCAMDRDTHEERCKSESWRSMLTVVERCVVRSQLARGARDELNRLGETIGDRETVTSVPRSSRCSLQR